MVIPDSDTAITFDSATNAYWLHHNWRNEESVSAAVIMGVAAVTNTPPTELDPLFDTVNADALNQLFTAGDDGDNWVSFEFNDCTVVVNAAGEMGITPAEDANFITDRVSSSGRDQ